MSIKEMPIVKSAIQTKLNWISILMLKDSNLFIFIYLFIDA